MTDTTTRPLPVDRQALRAFMPPEPESSVTQARAAIGRIDQQIAACREQITQRDEHDHQLVSDLIGAAVAGGKLEPIAARMVPGDRAALDWRFDQLQQARLLAGHRLTQLERNDPIHLAWKQACAEVEREWQLCQSAETSEDRFQALVAFSARH